MRIRYRERPPRDEYRLTRTARDLWMLLLALREWGDRWNAGSFGVPMETIERDTGRPLRLALVDAETGERVPPEHATLRPEPDADDGIRIRLGGGDPGS